MEEKNFIDEENNRLAYMRMFVCYYVTIYSFLMILIPILKFVRFMNYHIFII